MENKTMQRTFKIALVGVFTAVSALLYLVEVPLFPVAAPFLKLNPADIGSLFIAAVISPYIGELVLVLRCVVHLLMTQTFGVGEFMDMLIGSAAIVMFWLCFLRGSGGTLKFSRRYVIGVAVATVAMAVVGAVGNMIAYPLYEWFMTRGGFDVLKMADTFRVIILFVTPLNFARGMLDFILMALLLPTARKLRTKL